MKFWMLLLYALAADTPREAESGKLPFPADYREWVFLSSGLGMTYGPGAAAANANTSPNFDNVFVNPSSYREFLKTGKWPGGTVFLLEIRNSESHGSINRDGHYQTQFSRLEAEVKNERGEWKFYNFPIAGGKVAGDAVPLAATASCYGCHSKNTAVENTFVQFYPVLMDVAQRMGTVKAAYQK